MEEILFPKIKRNELTTLQVNVGYRCNQRCTHCHVDAGPHRVEMMSPDLIKIIPDVLQSYDLSILDITGGAPELHPDFKHLVVKAKELGVEVIDRCNLTILNEPGFEDLAVFLAKHDVKIIASLPCYEIENVDKQRGKGVFKSSIIALQKLNKLGYGIKDSNLILNLIFNPQGPSLPPPQEELERLYRHKLLENYGISFNNLYTLANMPIKRYAEQLAKSGQLEKYQELLIKSHNINNIDNVMCKSLISVDWQGELYDCDFNQQLGLTIDGSIKNLKDLISFKKTIENNSIQVGNHCFGCTAGNGSSCGGQLST